MGYLPSLVGDMFSVLSPWANEPQNTSVLNEESSCVVARRPTSSQKVSQIPMEVVLEILEAAYYDDNMEPDVAFLANCALVSKAWSLPAQKLLFRHVHLRSNSAFLAFRSTVDRSTDRGRVLGDAVLRMRVTLDHNHPDRLTNDAFANAVLLCQNLYELDISLYGQGASEQDSSDASVTQRTVPSLDAGVLNLLRSGPRIHALKLANWSDSDHLPIQLLSGIWPSLTSVVLKGLPPRLPADVDALVPFRCNLSEIRMNFQVPPKLDFVRWLLQDSVRSLRIVEFEREPSSELLDFIVHQHGSSLESLSIPSCSSIEMVSAVQRCERLKELKLESPTLTPLLFKQLPSSVEHLAFGMDVDTPLHIIVKYIKEMDNVKTVTVHYWDGGERHSLLPTFKIACACKGVELLTMCNLQRFRTIVVSHHFIILNRVSHVQYCLQCSGVIPFRQHSSLVRRALRTYEQWFMHPENYAKPVRHSGKYLQRMSASCSSYWIVRSHRLSWKFLTFMCLKTTYPIRNLLLQMSMSSMRRSEGAWCVWDC